MSQVRLKTLPDDAQELILEMARVSAVDPLAGSTRLIKYLIDNHHWSPFEMVTMVVEIHTTRDISRQILRHRSFSFQEFSQRYQDVSVLQTEPILREARTQDKKNRQNSLPIANDDALSNKWAEMQQQVWQLSFQLYQEALAMGIAKEQARALLPEGLTRTKMYMSGTIRSWLHYCELRSSNGTQKEHADIAKAIRSIIAEKMPDVAKAFNWSS